MRTKEEILHAYFPQIKRQVTRNPDYILDQRSLRAMQEYAEELAIGFQEYTCYKFGRESKLGWFALGTHDPSPSRTYLTTEQLLEEYKKFILSNRDEQNGPRKVPEESNC